MTKGHSSRRILICDDDSLFRKTLDLALRDYGTVTATANSDEALQVLSRRQHDLLVLDVQMRTSDEGLRALPKLRALDPELSIIVMSGLRDFKTVREAMRLGANDYVVKDFEPEEFKLAVERALDRRERTVADSKRQFEAHQYHARYTMVGESPRILETKRLLEKFRASPANVLITGETGTGKEIAARQLRKTLATGELEPFVAVDSATLHSNTAESILFGHEKGAFTGAEQTRKGIFEEADGGLVFFDEIGNMPLSIQAKLLRVLQEKEVVRMGSTRTIPLEFRVVAATNRNLEAMGERGEFMPDLLQRLNVLPLSLPPLRERQEDIPLLIEHFLKRKASGRVSVTLDAHGALQAYSWPGNVRELAALLDYSLAMIDGTEIDVADLHPKIRETRPDVSAGASSEGQSFYDRMSEFEKSLLAAEYQKAQGNISKLALLLGMDRSHLHSKLKTYGIHTVKK